LARAQPQGLTAFAGLTLVLETMAAVGLDEVVRERLRLRERQRADDEFDKLHALCGAAAEARRWQRGVATVGQPRAGSRGPGFLSGGGDGVCTGDGWRPIRAVYVA
jgi:hypothetical protein